jgi:hypothetical protein
MPIDYTSTTGSLQVRLGKIISTGKDLRSQQGSTLTNIQEVAAQYTATTIDKAEWVGPLLTRDSERIVDQMARPLQENVREAVEKTVLQTVNTGLREVPDVDTALRLLAVDMIQQSQSIATTGISASAVTNTAGGSGTIILATDGKFVYGGAKYASKQGVNQSILAETINARCIKDARDGSLLRGNERWQVEGQGAVDRLDRRWQDGTSGYGSGAVLALNSTCGDVEASRTRGQNMLSNSGFERDDGTFALDWQIATGTAGTTLVLDKVAARGVNSIGFVGNSSILHNIYEVMGTGPRPNLKTNTVYIISAYLRADSGTVNTGTIRFGLRDNTNAEISGCSINRNMAGVGLSVPSTGWTRITGSFTTPLTLGPDTRFAINFTVALGAQTLLVDEVVLAEAVSLYGGGIGVAVVAGTSDWELDDRMAASVAKTAAEWQVELDRYLNLAGRDIQLPVSTSPTFASTHIG